jgi:hypothetical protein
LHETTCCELALLMKYCKSYSPLFWLNGFWIASRGWPPNDWRFPQQFASISRLRNSDPFLGRGRS